jgi:hypothetical protein
VEPGDVTRDARPPTEEEIRGVVEKMEAAAGAAARDRADHVACGWDATHTLRWIEVGRLRLEESGQGGIARVLPPRAPIETPDGSIQGPPVPALAGASAWLSAGELAGLVRLLGSWLPDEGRR